MKLFPMAPIVANGLATNVFRRQWSLAPVPLGKTPNPLMPSLKIADERGFPTREFVLVWKATREEEINIKVPMVQADGTPTKEFLKLWEGI